MSSASDEPCANGIEKRQLGPLKGKASFRLTEDFAITDEEGKYSIYGLSATTHTVKVDVTTLPGGAKLEALTHRHGLRGGSGTTAWADLKNGELQIAQSEVKRSAELLGCMRSIRLVAGRPTESANAFRRQISRSTGA